MAASTLFLSDRVEIDAAGAGTIRFPQVPPFQSWAITRISVTMTGGVLNNTGGEARIFRNQAIDPNFVDGTNTPWNDVYAAALELLPAELLIVVFSGCGVGEVGTVTVQGIRNVNR